MAQSEAYLALLDAMRDLHIRKSAGYSGDDNPDAWANFRRCEAFGIPAIHGIITRMSDKWSRVQNLFRSAANEQVGESLEDTLIDLASYALTLVCLLREKRKPDQGKVPRKNLISIEPIFRTNNVCDVCSAVARFFTFGPERVEFYCEDHPSDGA